MQNNTSNKKLQELIIYISTRCADDKDFGKTKLNKILFYSDFLYYFYNQQAITNAKYVHLPNGPIPDNMDTLLQSMTLDGDIGTAIEHSGPYKRQRIVALREPVLDEFEPKMISHIDNLIDHFCYKNNMKATHLSLASHDMMGWLVTQVSAEIPYQTIFLKNKSKQLVSAWETNHAKELATSLKGSYGF